MGEITNLALAFLQWIKAGRKFPKADTAISHKSTILGPPWKPWHGSTLG